MGRLFASVLGVTFLVLLMTFRSVVIAAKAIALNVLGVAAAFGAVVAAYQFGWGTVLGLPKVNGISPYMPVFMFALVFGLSMDYHVFLLSRIKERYDATGDNRRAIVEGLARTGPLITGAAAHHGRRVQRIRRGEHPRALAMGVRPGRRRPRGRDRHPGPARPVRDGVARPVANWYLPRWLEWLPRLSFEAPQASEEPEGEREPALA